MNKPFIFSFVESFPIAKSDDEITEYSYKMNLNVLKGSNFSAVSLLNMNDDKYIALKEKFKDVTFSESLSHIIHAIRGETTTRSASESTDRK